MSAVVEVGGLGYKLFVPLSTSEGLRGKETVSLYTHLLVREDSLRLFGFATRGERDLFGLLLSVSGVGPTTALEALSRFAADALVEALAAGDAESLRQVKGVGKKLADRMVLELKERMVALTLQSRDPGVKSPRRTEPRSALELPEAAEAVAALVELGYQRKDARARVEASCRRLLADGTVGVEALIRRALERN